MSRKGRDRPRGFPWGGALRNAGVKGAEAAAITAATASVTSEPTVVAILTGIAFVGTAGFAFTGEYVNYRADDPAPVFDGPTTFLFDTVGMVFSFLLFGLSALRLDHMLNPEAPLPGVFGFMTLFLSAFLITVLRGLLCNLGLAREEGDERVDV